MENMSSLHKKQPKDKVSHYINVLQTKNKKLFLYPPKLHVFIKWEISLSMNQTNS